MDNDSNNSNSYTDEIKAQNAVLRLKLEMDHGMQAGSAEKLGPQLENMWLNSILDYEKQLKTAPRITLRVHLGNPAVRKWDTLKPGEIHKELCGLLDLMRSKRVVLDCLHEVEELVLYRFITEELFEEEIMQLGNSNIAFHFIYEEFHPAPEGDS